MKDDENIDLESYITKQINNINAQTNSHTFFLGTQPTIKKNYIYLMFGDVILKRLYDDTDIYSLTFDSLLETIIKFQLWSNNNTELKKNREIKIFNTKNWIKSNFIKKSTNNFTCILQLETGKEINFKINKFAINKYGKVKFYVSYFDDKTINFFKKHEFGTLIPNNRCIIIDYSSSELS